MNPSGERAVWKNIWGAHVSNIVKVFGWKLASNGLATNTKHSRLKRTLDQISTCELCGCSSENSFHAVVGCLHAGWLKINFDGSFLPHSEEALAGIVATG